MIYLHFVVLLVTILRLFLTTDGETVSDKCPLWHIHTEKGQCECGTTLNGIVHCDETFLYIKFGYCMTWNNSTGEEELSRCLTTDKNTCMEHTIPITDRISAKIPGEELNHITCDQYNRQGKQCAHCIDGFGPAAFSDGPECADCSKHRNLWMIYLLLQVSMVTLMYIIFILLQIRGTSSPLNIIITYVQLGVLGYKLSGVLHINLACHLGHTFTKILVSVVSILNMDFFREFLPPMCISKSLKAIHMLFFDFLIAIYPLVLTIVIFIAFDLYDRHFKLLVLFSYPIRKVFSYFHASWDPRTNILNVYITFFLLSYTKLLFASISLLVAVNTYNKRGEITSTVLLYDPSIIFFSAEHIPYVILAMSTILTFILLPACVLLFYPTRFFRKCISLSGFKRTQVILNHIMDIFQGWYKDGTEGSRDYRYLSTLSLVLRIGFSYAFIQVIFWGHKIVIIREWVVLGVIQVFLGVFYLAAKPYRKVWMCHVDGVILILIGTLLFLPSLDHTSVYVLGLIVAAVVVCSVCAYSAFKYGSKNHN